MDEEFKIFFEVQRSVLGEAKRKFSRPATTVGYGCWFIQDALSIRSLPRGKGRLSVAKLFQVSFLPFYKKFFLINQRLR